MPNEFLFSGEPLPLSPSLTGDPEHDVEELLVFHAKLLDYLRRLAAKLSNQTFTGSGTDVETLALYRDANQTGMANNVFDDLEWDRQIRVDAAYSHDTSTPAGSELFHFNKDGFYLLHLDLKITTNHTIETQLVDSDNSDEVLSWSKGSTTSTVVQRLPYLQTVAFHAHAGQNLAMQVRINGSGSAIVADETRLTILRLGELIGGGPDAIDPCAELEIWQLWCI